MAQVEIPSVRTKRRRTRPYDTQQTNSDQAVSALFEIVPPPGALMPTLSEVDPGNGWKLCNGSALSKSDYPRLYQIFGARFGETSDTFNLPDLRGRTVMGADSASVGLMAMAGAAEVTLAVNQMPAHDHGVTDSGHSHGLTSTSHSHAVDDPGHTHDAAEVASSPNAAAGSDVTGAVAGQTSTSGTGITVGAADSGGSVDIAQTGISVQEAGGGEPIDITPPVIGVNWLVRA